MKTLIFYSGKLWHSDKPFPVNKPIKQAAPVGSSGVAKIMHSLKIERWLSTAYEVQNPKAIPQIRIMWEGDRKCLHFNNGAHSLKELVDGDQITLPDGYGIEKKESWGPFHENTFAERVATITLPEKLLPVKLSELNGWYRLETRGKTISNFAKSIKYTFIIDGVEQPDNSAHGYTQTPCDNSLCSCQHEPGKGFKCAAPHLIGRKVEPSESQEETQESLIREIMDTYAHRWHKATTENQHKNIVQEFWEHFTITRK